MKKIRALLILGSAVILAGVTVIFSACEISSGNETVREVSLQVSGNYVNNSGIPGKQSGQLITSLFISQNGDQLNAIDNLGARWTGTIGRASGNLATVNLDGITSNGTPVVITGNITIDGTTATLQGTWVEPVIRAPAFAQATVAPQPIPTPNPIETATPGATPIPGTTPTPVGTTTPVLQVLPPTS